MAGTAGQVWIYVAEVDGVELRAVNTAHIVQIYSKDDRKAEPSNAVLRMVDGSSLTLKETVAQVTERITCEDAAHSFVAGSEYESPTPPSTLQVV